LALFPWAHFITEKGAIKLHTILNVRSQIPEMVIVTDGKVGDITLAKMVDFSVFPKGSIFVFDRAYLDYGFLYRLTQAGHHFVMRTKTTTQIFPVGKSRKPIGEGVLKDETVAFSLDEAHEDYPKDLRLVTFHDSVHDKTYEFLTDEFRLSALNIALIYKQRWEVELFFKWIKQHLKIKTFLGTSKNAVLTQIWVAMIYYLLLSFIKHQTKFAGSLLELSRIFAEVILQKVHLIDLLSLTPKTLHRLRSRAGPQLQLF
jgi:transposase